jgi:hypothetical protein
VDFAPPYFSQKNLRNVSGFAQDFSPLLALLFCHTTGTVASKKQPEGILKKEESFDGSGRSEKSFIERR